MDPLNVADTFSLEKYKGDLESLIASNFGSGGQYCHNVTADPAASATVKHGLSIQSVGPIDLPLSHGDAARLVSRAEPLGLELWGFASTQVAFAKNPGWQALRDKLMKEIWMDLSPYEERPSFKLDKLLLYGPGSSVEAYPKSQSNERSFATLQILLPSRYIGGRVEITYGTASTYYDVDQASENTVSAIAWYSDAVYKTEPIVSGYRLALSYEIIHVFPTPVPNLRFMLDNLTKLRHLLGYWTSENTSPLMPRMLAFILKGVYRENELVGNLMRNDGRKLQPVADLLGFKLFFAVLNCRLSGDADDGDEHVFPKSGPMRWSRPFLDGHKPPTMAVLRSKRLEAKEFVDLDGDHYVDMAGWSLEQSDILLHEPLEKHIPDAVEYEGSTHDRPGSLKFSFQKSILCIIPTRTYLEFLGHVLPHRMPRWNRVFGPSDSKDAILILKLWSWDRLAPFIPRLGDVAMQKGNLALWGHILDAAVSGLGIDRRVLESVAFFRACDAFSFEPTVARLQQSVEHEGLSRLILVANIPEYDSTYSKTISAWRMKYTRHIFQSMIELGEKEVAILVEVTKQGDMRFVRDIIIPELTLKWPSSNFCIELAKAMSAQRLKLLPDHKSLRIIFDKQNSAAPGSAEDQLAIFDEVFDKCLDLAILSQRKTLYLDGHIQDSRTHVIQIVELCIITRHLGACRVLLQHILGFAWSNSDTATQQMFEEFAIPLVRDLRSLLKEYTIPVSAPPFSNFFGVLIMRYIEYILGPQPFKDVTPGTIGCECSKCAHLVQFLTSADYDELHVLATKSILDHMKGHLQRITQRTKTRITAIQGRHKMEIRKHLTPSQQEWNNRKGKARNFLSLMGEREEIRKIFGGTRHESVELLLESDNAESTRRMTIDLGEQGI